MIAAAARSRRNACCPRAIRSSFSRVARVPAVLSLAGRIAGLPFPRAPGEESLIIAVMSCTGLFTAHERPS